MRRCLLSPCFPMQFMKDCSDDVAEIQRRGPQYGNVDMANHRWAGNDHGYGWEFAMSKRINVQSTHGKFAKLRVSAETSAAAFGWELHKSDSALRAESTLVKAHLALAGSDELVRAEILDPNLDHTAEDMPSSSHKMRKPVQKKA